MGVIVPFKRLPEHRSIPWADAREPWHADVCDRWDRGEVSASELRRLMAEDAAFARYATRRLGWKAGARLCGND